ncbi:putative acyl-activating enzyme 19 isoform X2 [Syzygium oleosum]|uniref:putative acyl-activating enzyme 19 isoform X2 n=1 Tax=Syzygium oleosum TaxID=219896 RepID=UPI0024BBB262|nr:putative acyl-activating enzyme 19 isoform X2 [Syzygium oleosum]
MSEAEQQPRRCCLSHAFSVAASANPSKIALVHAYGGAVVPGELRQTTAAGSGFSAGGVDRFCDGRARSLSPPLYPGDQCFAYSDVSLAVDCLSSRLRNVLDGGDDPDLIKPSGKSYRSGDEAAYTFRPGTAQLMESGDVYVPKVIGIYTPPSVEYIVSVLSVLRCGEAFLAIDPMWPKERMLSIVSRSNVELIIACKSSFGKSHGRQTDWIVESGSCPVVLFSMEESTTELSRHGNIVWPCVREKRRLFCYLMYTSGSTGKPKGVCGTEEGLLNRFSWMQRLYPLHGKELLLFKTSISFVDHLQEFLASILCACTLVIPPLNKLKHNALVVADFLEAYHISRLIAVPSLMKAIIPAMLSRVPRSLELLVLSGEEFSVSLWKELTRLLPKTTILNLYGSTEVAGDCTYFDCKRLPMMLEAEKLSNVPIGLPISNCEVVLVGEDGELNHGEVYVGGVCISSGYMSELSADHLDYVELPHNSSHYRSDEEHQRQLFIRTGDFAKQLASGDFVFLGRKDHIVKINGQRIALGEIESMLRGHEAVLDAAVVCHKGPEELVQLEAFLLLNEKKKPSEVSGSIRHWMVEKLPYAMVPHHFVFLESFPRTSSGKVDYELLSASVMMHSKDNIDTDSSNVLEVIKKAFCDALMIEEVSDDDDFFSLGGNSIAAAHASHNLGISMKSLYDFPTPSKLQIILLEKQGLRSVDLNVSDSLGMNSEANERKSSHVDKLSEFQLVGLGQERRLTRTISPDSKNDKLTSKRLKFSSEVDLTPEGPWKSMSLLEPCSLSRCNRVMYEDENSVKDVDQQSLQLDFSRDLKGLMHEVWKAPMESCVDASPLLVVRDQEICVFIGSHSQRFVRIDAKSGHVLWEIKLDGRIECSAAVTSDFSQVVVGCYEGKIYFVDFSNGKICWTFQTGGEVKSQPVADGQRQLIWCGSHDHNLYALDYKNHQCLFNISCGGSIFGSPAIDEVRTTLYVGSTSGRVTALCIKAVPFYVLWLYEFEVPVFGSLSVCSPSGLVICCLVNGSVVALDTTGSIIWKRRTGGPIFAGASIASVLPTQENGEIYWEYDAGYPITASAYLDEHLRLSADRLVCICTCSGSVVVLRIDEDVATERNQQIEDRCMVQEFARLELEGDVFSSPVMIGGIIFVGCRDDHLHCIAVGSQSSVIE